MASTPNLRSIDLLPSAVGEKRCLAWRLDRTEYALDWDKGEGAFRVGGRWNSKGVACVYASLDVATAILEVAVHIGFRAMNTIRYVLTCLEIAPGLRIVTPAEVPNSNWLLPGAVSAGQQRFGDAVLAKDGAFAAPSAVSRYSWNVMLSPAGLAYKARLVGQTPFSLDTRLDPA